VRRSTETSRITKEQVLRRAELKKQRVATQQAQVPIPYDTEMEHKNDKRARASQIEKRQYHDTTIEKA